MEYGGGVTTLVGPGSIGVPGSFAAVGKVSEQHGRVRWRELMDTVADLLEDGFPMSHSCHVYLQHSGEPIFSDDPAARAALYHGDRLRDEGETVVFEGLTDTLRSVGAQGWKSLYTGELAREMVSDLTARGGNLTFEDLASYRPIRREPLKIDVAGWRICLNPPPAIGGATVALALSLLAGPDRSSADDLADALAMAFETRASELAPGPDMEANTWKAMARAGLASPSTIAVSAVDEDGNGVAASFSGGYGSGVAPTGTGFLMNNGVGEMELAGDAAGEEGARLTSNMSPMIGRQGSDVVAVASPGASRITSALVTTVAALGEGRSLRDAIEAPRVHPEFGEWGLRIATEPGVDLVRHVARPFDEMHMYFGGATGASFQKGELDAHADSRRTGSAVVIDGG